MASVVKISAHKVFLVLNNTCRSITEYLQSSNIELYLLVGIAPPAIGINFAAQRERDPVNNAIHPLQTHTVPKKPLKSRSSFMYDTGELIDSSSTRRIKLWFNHLQSVLYKLMQTLKESLASDAYVT